MTQQIAIGNISLLDLEQKQQLQLAESPDFFPEWRENLPDLFFGLVTNGGSLLVIKLVRQEHPQYQVSDVMLLLPGRNQLYLVLRVLKKLKQAIA